MIPEGIHPLKLWAPPFLGDNWPSARPVLCAPFCVPCHAGPRLRESRDERKGIDPKRHASPALWPPLKRGEWGPDIGKEGGPPNLGIGLKRTYTGTREHRAWARLTCEPGSQGNHPRPATRRPRTHPLFRSSGGPPLVKNQIKSGSPSCRGAR